MYSPPQVIRWAKSISVTYRLAGSGSLRVSKTVDSFFSITTIVPLEEGVLFLPRLTGSVRITVPFSETVIRFVALSTVISNARPIFAVALRSMLP